MSAEDALPSGLIDDRNNKIQPIPPPPPPLSDPFQDAQRTPKGSKCKGYSRHKQSFSSGPSSTDFVPDTSFFDGFDSFNAATNEGPVLLEQPDDSYFKEISKKTDKHPLLLEPDISFFEAMSTPLVVEEQQKDTSSDDTDKEICPTTRKSKLEKIYELQSQNKSLKQEQKLLKTELENLSRRCIKMEKSSKAKIASMEEQLKDHDQFQEFKIHRQKNEMDQRFEAIKALKAVAIKQEKKIQDYVDKIKRMKKEAKDKDEHIEEIEKAMAQMKKASLRLQKELAANQTEINGLQRELTKALEEVDTLVEESDTNVTQIKELSEELEQCKNEKQKTEEELENVQNSLMKTSKMLEQKEVELKEIKGELASKIQNILEMEMSVEESRDELKDEQEKREERLQQAREDLEAKFKEEMDKMTAKLEEEKMTLNQTIEDKTKECGKMEEAENKAREEFERISRINAGHLEKIKDLEREKEMYRTLADNESIRWSSSTTAETEEKKKKQLRLDDVLSGAMFFDDTSSSLTDSKKEETDSSSATSEEKQKIIKFQQENEMLRSWARKALEQVRRLEKENKASKQCAATMQKKLENQQKMMQGRILGGSTRKIGIGEGQGQEAVQSNVKEAATKISSPAPVTISGEVTSEKMSSGMDLSRHNDTATSLTIAKPHRWGLLNRLTSQDSIARIIVEENSPETSVTRNGVTDGPSQDYETNAYSSSEGSAKHACHGSETSAIKFRAAAEVAVRTELRAKITSLQEANTELNVTLSSLRSGMAQLKENNETELDKIRMENKKLQQENDAHSIKITVLENMLKENGVGDADSFIDEKKEKSIANSPEREKQSSSLCMESPQHKELDFSGKKRSKSLILNPLQPLNEKYIIRDLEAKVTQKDIKIVSLQKKNDTLNRTISSLRNGMSDVSTTNDLNQDPPEEEHKSQAIGSDHKGDDSSPIISDLRTKLFKSNRRIEELQDEIDHQHENYERVIQTLRQDIADLKREKLQMKSESKRQLQLVNEEKSKMEEDLQEKLQSHEETIVSLERTVDQLRENKSEFSFFGSRKRSVTEDSVHSSGSCFDILSQSGDNVPSNERTNERTNEEDLMNQPNTLKAEWEEIEKDLNLMIAERDAKIESLEKELEYFSLMEAEKDEIEEDLKLKLSGKNATIVHLEEEISSLVSIKTEKDEVAKDLLNKLTEREATISNLEEEIRKLKNSAQSSSSIDASDAEVQDSLDNEKEIIHSLEKIEIIRSHADALFEKVNTSMDRIKQSKDQGVEDNDLDSAVDLCKKMHLLQEEVKMSLHIVELKVKNQIGCSKNGIVALDEDCITKEKYYWDDVIQLMRKAEDEMKKKIEGLESEVAVLKMKIQLKESVVETREI